MGAYVERSGEVWRRSMCELYAEAGYSQVRRVPMENPFNILYEVTP